MKLNARGHFYPAQLILHALKSNRTYLQMRNLEAIFV